MRSVYMTFSERNVIFASEKKMTKLSISWFYELLEKGECDIMDFKEQLEDKEVFGKSLKNYGPNYEEMARDVVAIDPYRHGQRDSGELNCPVRLMELLTG